MKNIILLLLILTVFLVARSAIHFTLAPTHELFGAYVSDDDLFPDEWYFTYIDILTLDDLSERRENKDVSLLQSVLVQRYEDTAGRAKTLKLFKLITDKGVSTNLIAEKNCIYFDYLAKGEELDILVYITKSLSTRKAKKECRNVLENSLSKYKNIVSEKSRLRIRRLVKDLTI